MKFLEKIKIIFFDILDKYFHQKNIITYLKKNIKNIEVFFDIGSHKGTYTDLIIKEYKVRKVVMVDPQKNIFKFIKKKYVNNKIVKTYNFAISDKKKKQTLYINKHDLTSSLTQIDKKNSYLNLKAKLFGGTINDLIQNKYMVNSCRLSEIIKKNSVNKIDLLKIDTEGHELQVLKGAGSFLKNKVNFMLIEIHNSNIFIDYDAKKIHNFLKKNKFILRKKYKFPFTTWEDRIYKIKILNNEYSRTSSKRNTKEFGAPASNGVVIFSTDDIHKEITKLSSKEFVLKAQIHAGGRGKAGGVKLIKNISDLEIEAKKMMGKVLVTHQTGPEGKKVKRLYIEEASDILKEYYLSCLIDRETSKIAFISSTEGGMDIEKVAADNPEKIVTNKLDLKTGGPSDAEIDKIISIFQLNEKQKNTASKLIKSLYNYNKKRC